MKKTVKTKASKNTTAGQKKVWRIFNFDKRYELPDDKKICRRSGLLFIKLFVGMGAGDEAVSYQQQMDMICNGDGVQTSMIKGLYNDLVSMAAMRSRHKRGYLLDAADEPLSISQMAKLLNYQQPTMNKWIKRFEEVRLLEKVEMPNFEELEKRTAKKGDKKDGDTENPKNQAENNDISGKDRKISENFGKKRKPFKERQTAKQPNGCKGINKQKATSGLTAYDCKRNNNGNGISAETNINTQNEGKDKPLPSEPQESDAGGCRVTQFTGPPVAVEISRQGLAYGRRIYLALKLPWDIDSTEADREIRSFGSKHDKVCRQLVGLGPPVVDTVLSQGRREATKIAKRPANKNRGAVWHTVVDKLADAQQRSPPGDQ